MHNHINKSLMAAWLSIWGNIILFAAKLALGIYINSLAIISDAFHSLSDTLTSIIAVVGIKISAKPPDKEHPFGHARAESIAALSIAIILSAVGVKILIHGIERIFLPQIIKPNLLIFLVLFITILVKIAMTIISHNIGIKTQSESLIADAFHHLSDALTTILVIIGFIFYYYKIYYIDGIISCSIALTIIYMGIKIASGNINNLLGSHPPQKFIDSIEKLVKTTPGVHGIHNILVHDYGRNKCISLHINVSDRLNVKEAHEIAYHVEKKIEDELKASVIVHVDPFDAGIKRPR